jgi:hypothetical protein
MAPHLSPTRAYTHEETSPARLRGRSGNASGGARNCGSGRGRGFLSHTRARMRACLSTGRPPLTQTMAGSPMRKLRKTGALDQVVVIPRLPPVAGGHKPPGMGPGGARQRRSSICSARVSTGCTTVSLGHLTEPLVGPLLIRPIRRGYPATSAARIAGEAADGRHFLPGRFSLTRSTPKPTATQEPSKGAVVTPPDGGTQDGLTLLTK